MTDLTSTLTEPAQVETEQDVTNDQVPQSLSRRSFLTSAGVGQQRQPLPPWGQRYS